MRLSLPSSLLLHGGLLVWAVIGFHETKPFTPPEPEAVEVSIIMEGPTQLTQGERNSKNLQTAMAKEAPASPALKETPKAKPPEPTPPPPPPPEAAKEEPPPPVKVAEPPPLPPKPPEPVKDEIAELVLKQDAEAKAEAQRKAAADAKAKADKAKAEADKAKADKAKADKAKADKAKADKAKADALAKQQPKDDFFDDMQKALKDNDPRKRAPQPSGPQIAQASNVKGPQAGAPEGTAKQLTASEGALLGSLMKRQVSKCWNINPGAEGVDKIKIEVEVRLATDGRIQGQPRVVSRGTGPLYSDMADSAMRALIQCQAYDLPKNLYKGGWDFMIVEFDPSRMF